MKKSYYSKEIANVVKQSLIEDEQRYSFNSKAGIFNFSQDVSNKIGKINYFIDVDADFFVIYGISGICADYNNEKVMAQMAEFICRINNVIRDGNFMVSYEDGEICFKIFVDCDEPFSSTQVVKYCIDTIVGQFDRYAEGFAKVIFEDSSAKQALEYSEKIFNEKLLKDLEELGIPDDDSVDLDARVELAAEKLGIIPKRDAYGNDSENTPKLNFDLFGKK